jgi:hypothetical protein
MTKLTRFTMTAYKNADESGSDYSSVMFSYENVSLLYVNFQTISGDNGTIALNPEQVEHLYNLLGQSLGKQDTHPLIIQY